MPDFRSGRRYTTSDLSTIVQEIVCRGVTAATATPGCPTPPTGGYPGNWASGNAMVFLSQYAGTSDRHVYSAADGTSSSRPRLSITYQKVNFGSLRTNGLRFTDMAIPQGAKITSATLTFTASTDSHDVDPANFPSFTIQGEKVGDAPSFAATSNNISSRPVTGASVTWDKNSGLTDWTAEETYNTPDLASVIQEVVDQPGWCGNNAIALIVKAIGSSNSTRYAYSFDNTGAKAPALSVSWDPNSVPSGGGCLNEIVTRQIAASADDAQEIASTGSNSLNSSTNLLGNNIINGLRFREMAIPQGATILEANLVFTANNSNTGSAPLTIKGENADESGIFTGGAYNISGRTTTSQSVSDDEPSWTSNVQYKTPDLTNIIQAIVNRSNWKIGNDLSLIISGSGQRRAYSFDNSPAQAPILNVKVKYTGTTAPYFKTVRKREQEIVSDFRAAGFTPIVGTMFEASQYLRGRDVVWGKNRSHIDANKANTRVSIAASYTGGTDVMPAGCTSLNLSATACKGEYISGNPVYTTPITSNASCAGNYIMMLSDGYANHNANEGSPVVDHGVSMIDNNNTNFPGIGACSTAYGSGEKCGRELAAWLHNNDLNPNVEGNQVVNKFFTIGFNLCSDFVIRPATGPAVCCTVNTDVDANGDPTCTSAHLVPDNSAQRFLKDVSKAGSGGELHYTDATTATDLVNYFTASIAEILQQPSTFASPSLSSNSFNKLFNRNDIYFAPFEPASSVRWKGNVKKYKICDGVEFTNCSFGEVLDQNGNPATDANGALLPDAKGVWTPASATTGDGIEVTKGGAEPLVPAAADRNIFTYTGAGAPSNVDLSSAANAVTVANTSLTSTLLGVSSTQRDSLINWIRGQDVDDENGNGNSSENRFVIADPLHSSPVVVGFGGTDEAIDKTCDSNGPVEKLFFTANDGTVHMLNACTGTEEWEFIPQELLPLQATLRANAAGTHLYGLDLTPVPDINDVNGDGIITKSEGDYVHIFLGMRDGGSNIYALDVTPNTPVPADQTDQGNGKVLPKLMWEIIGGAGSFTHMGKTWSSPKPTKIRFNNGTANVLKNVLIFGGGNDNTRDYTWGNTPTNTGNIVYIVDADTGALITSIGGTVDASNNGDAKLFDADMKYPVVSDIGLLDTNGDGATDRLYFGDLGGNVWRVDLNDNLSTSSTGKNVGTIGHMADISTSAGAVPGPFATETRSFYNAPAIVQIQDNKFSNEGSYDMVLLGTGSRPHPLDTTVHNVFYAFRDYTLGPLLDSGTGIAVSCNRVDTNGDGVPDACTGSTKDGYPLLTKADLFDVTPNPFQTDDKGLPVAAVASSFDTNLTKIKQSAGWFIELRENPEAASQPSDFIGEKNLAKASVLQGKLFFTTYVPTLTATDINECKLSEGDARVYGMDVLSGAALFADWDSSGDATTPNTADRTLKVTGGGIPSAVVPYFGTGGSDGSISSGGFGKVSAGTGVSGGFKIWNPGIEISITRTYWYEQR